MPTDAYNFKNKMDNNCFEPQRFYENRGIRQGCPISQFYFLLAIQIMALHVKNSNFVVIKFSDKELKLSIGR